MDWEAEFQRDAPLGVEIGFGMGHALGHWASVAPHLNLVGIELYQPGIGSLMLELEQLAATNVRVLEADAAYALACAFAPGSIAELRIFFPDPWPKRRHHKRRLIQPAFVELVAGRLAQGAVLRIATDWEPYGAWIQTCCDAEPRLENPHAGFASGDRADRPLTRFEQRGLAAGRRVWELEYLRRDHG